MNITKVDLSPSNELSYILGVRFGDGTLYRQTRETNKKGKGTSTLSIIQLVAKDKDFVEEFSNCFSKISNKIYTAHRYGIYYRTQPCSEQFYDFVINKKATDFMGIINKHPNSFVKGFFDSEGCVDITSAKGRRIRMSNTDLSLLEFVKELLHKLGINSKIHREKKIGTKVVGKNGKEYTKTKDVFRLHIPTKLTPLFSELISSSIQRKKERMVVDLL